MYKHTHAYLFVLGLNLVLFCLQQRAIGQMAAIEFIPGSVAAVDNAENVLSDSQGSFVLGVSFSVTQPITITALGSFLDASYDGSGPAFDSIALPGLGTNQWVSTHPTGIYEVHTGTNGGPDSGNILTAATISSSNTRDGEFIYHSVAGPTLLPGLLYLIATVTGPKDRFAYAVQNLATPSGVGLLVNPNIQFGEPRYGIGDSLSVFPEFTDSFATPGYLGGNFKFIAAVPEPDGCICVAASIVLLGATSMVMRQRKRARIEF